MIQANHSLVLHVLDDEPDICRHICVIADAMGFNTHSTESPAAFLESHSVDVDVLVLDLYMPGMDGIELLRYLAEGAAPRHLILISGGDSIVLRSAQKLAQELELNVVGTLHKPFRRRALEQVLRKVLEADAIFTKPKPAGRPPTFAELREAIITDAIDVVFQPQVRSADQKLVGFEALARWQHPQLGNVSPLQFIAIAEQGELIAELDRLVMKKAIGWLALFKDFDPDLRLSVNMSARTLSDLALPEWVVQELDQRGIAAESLAIEVTETALMTDLVKSLDILTRLRMKGVTLSIDDFGTGYSSMAQLVRIPFTELKIDGSFIEGGIHNKECRAVVKASTMLARELGMQVVAERVSSAQVLELVQELECDLAQGFFTGRPVGPEQIVQLLLNPSQLA